VNIVVNKADDIKAIVTMPNINVPPTETFFRKKDGMWLNVGPVQFAPMPVDSFVNAIYLECEVATVLVRLHEPITLLANEVIRFETGQLGFAVVE
jgi:hypothetical protein